MRLNLIEPDNTLGYGNLKGMAPYPLFGEDAQEWLSRTRQEGDEHRERLSQTK